jgi:hypothetical protein
LKKEYIFRAFYNRVLNRLFRYMREEIRVRGSWRKLPEDEFRDVYSCHKVLGDEIKDNEMGGVFNMHGRDDKMLVGKRDGKK